MSFWDFCLMNRAETTTNGNSVCWAIGILMTSRSGLSRLPCAYRQRIKLPVSASCPQCQCEPAIDPRAASSSVRLGGRHTHAPCRPAKRRSLVSGRRAWFGYQLGTGRPKPIVAFFELPIRLRIGAVLAALPQGKGLPLSLLVVGRSRLKARGHYARLRCR